MIGVKMQEDKTKAVLKTGIARSGKVIVLTGAGISKESGIPTFRGKDGYWTVGSSVYRPEEMATQAAFHAMPEEVWRWYLYRLRTCRAAKPNAAHFAVVDLEAYFGDRFCLITQNVDGLHLRAGSSAERTYQIHGNIGYTRCADACSNRLWELPSSISDSALGQLRCGICQAWARPHVLWFDECYDEQLFRLRSSLCTAQDASLLISVGTSGLTNLPRQILEIAASAGASVLDINVEDNPFARHARSLASGAAINGPAAQVLPDLVGLITNLTNTPT